MDDDKQNQNMNKNQPNVQPQAPRPVVVPRAKPVLSENVKAVRRVCGYVTITSTTLFAFIAILSVWGLFDGSDVVWRSFSSLAIIGFAALIVATVSPLIDRH
jgi:membrane protein YdbS with pleckstrin-like domain